MEGRSFAIVIGIDVYASESWRPLSYARRDASAVAELMKSKGFEVVEVYDRDATRHAILSRTEEVAHRLVSGNPPKSPLVDIQSYDPVP